MVTFWPDPAMLLSPVTSKPASRGRIKTGHSEVLYSFQVFSMQAMGFQLFHASFSGDFRIDPLEDRATIGFEAGAKGEWHVGWSIQSFQ